jgi:hypothetical protein
LTQAEDFVSLRNLKVGDLVKLDPMRMTNRGYVPPNWDMKAVLMVLWVPGPDSPSQVVSVLMNGTPCTVSAKHLKRVLPEDM